MKKIIKETGEIIELSLQESFGRYYWSNGEGKYYSLKDVEDYDIVLENRRYELVKAAMQGIYANPNLDVICKDEIVVDLVIKSADLMIEKLRKDNKNSNEHTV